MIRLLATANAVPSSLILVTLMMAAICSSETSVLTTATLCNILEDRILHSHCCENFKSYILPGCSLESHRKGLKTQLGQLRNMAEMKTGSIYE
jgi:hypothetical protein